MFGNKYLSIVIMALRLLGPCIVKYLQDSNAAPIAGMDPGKKSALIALMEALNTKDDATKKRMEAAEKEVIKIQGGS